MAKKPNYSFEKRQKELAKKAKECFSSAVKCYDNLNNNLIRQNKYKKEKDEFLSNNAFKLTKIISDYYKLRKKTDDLINESVSPIVVGWLLNPPSEPDAESVPDRSMVCEALSNMP